MKQRRFSLLVVFSVAGLLLAGCGRKDTRANSDPEPGLPSRADTGRPVETTTPSGDAAVSPTTGTDSQERPGDASGGTTPAGAASTPGGTQSTKRGGGR